jgi:YesN/AraC family two-component response regulator
MSIKILLADDHKITRQGLSLLINNQPDMEVVAEAANGREAVELADKLAPEVIIMDVSMPDLNGIQIRLRNAQMRGIRISAEGWCV